MEWVQEVEALALEVVAAVALVQAPALALVLEVEELALEVQA